MADKQLSPRIIERFSSSFQKDDKNQLAQNAAAALGIQEVMVSQDKLKGRVHVYNTQTPLEGRPVSDQVSTKRCWIFAILNAIRIPVMIHFGLKEFEFSYAYLNFWNKLEYINTMLERVIETRHEPLHSRKMVFLLKNIYLDGGYWDMAVNLIRKYGLVPKEHYPETHSSQDSRSMDLLIATKLREYCCRLRGMVDSSEEELRKEKGKMLQEIYNICRISLGTPPTSFTWEYKDKSGAYKCIADLTPSSFYETLVKPVFDVEEKVVLRNDPRPENPYMKLYGIGYLANVLGMHASRYINLPMDQLKAYAVKSIKAGQPFWTGCDIKQHLHFKSGLNELEIHDTQLAFGVSTLDMNKSDRLRYMDSCMTHAMVVTAVHLKDGKEDQPVRWRTENSWGKSKGDGGYFMMSDQWFNEFVYEVVVDKSVVPQEVLDVLKQEIVVLPPWDGMGPLGAKL